MAKTKKKPRTEAWNAGELAPLALAIASASANVEDGAAGVRQCPTCECYSHTTWGECCPLPEPTEPTEPAEPNPAILAGLRDAHSTGRARRASLADVTATLGSVAVNVSRAGDVTVKVQGFLPLDLTLALRARARPGESNTAILERVLRDALAGSIPVVTPEVMSAVARARASAPVAPSARARVEAQAARPVREVLE